VPVRHLLEHIMTPMEDLLREHRQHENRLITISALWTALVLCAAGCELIERAQAAILAAPGTAPTAEA
jgi:hypothetical protein